MRTLQLAYDMFFITAEFYNANVNHLKQVLVLPKKDFLNHSDYSSVINLSNHATWKIRFDYVIIATEGWYELCGEDFKRAIAKEIIQNGDALILNGEPLTIQKWRALDDASKTHFLQTKDDVKCDFNLDMVQGFDYLKQHHNRFPKQHGANCFASVVYAVSQNEEFMHHWVFSDTFLLFLQANGYQLKEEINALHLIQPKDVLVIYANEQPIHTVYCLNEKICFNKFGQTMHEQWMLCEIDDVLKEFQGTSWKIYRK